MSNKIKAIVMDCDGVLTNGNVRLDITGKETKEISFLDIMGISLGKKAGLKFAIISGEGGDLLNHIARKCGIKDVYAFSKNKALDLKDFANKYELRLEEICYMGDDVNDLEALSISGLPVMKGSVRDTIDLILDDSITVAADRIIESLKNGGRVLICGNGGSAADAQHIAAEFVGRYLKERPPFDAIALTTNTSVLTAIGNDYGFNQIFSRQVQAHGRPGDILIAISTSGTSKNILSAIWKARTLGITTIGFSGTFNMDCDINIVVNRKITPRIQEEHIRLAHELCQKVEEGMIE